MLFVSSELEPVLILVLPTLPQERIREASDESKAKCQMWSKAKSGVPSGLPHHSLGYLSGPVRTTVLQGGGCLVEEDPHTHTNVAGCLSE